jgi:predicted Zn-dependent peptidase
MKEITALGRMAAREGKIQELVNDERGDENSGMSQADLRKAEQLQAAAQYLLRRDVMDRLNINGDRFVDKRELEFALRTQNMRPQDRAMLNYLRTNYAKFQEGANNERGDENSGVSMQDLQYYAGLV